MVANNTFCSYCVKVKVLITQSRPTLAILWTVARQAPLSCLDFPGKNIGVGCHALLQGMFPAQESNLDWRSISHMIIYMFPFRSYLHRNYIVFPCMHITSLGISDT